MRQTSILTVSLLVAMTLTSATSAAGQIAQTPQQQSGGAIGRLTADQQMSRFENEEQRRRMTLTPEEAEAEYGQERMDFARRVAALVEEGKCAEARALANEAGERQMALRIRRTCREGSGGSSAGRTGN